MKSIPTDKLPELKSDSGFEPLYHRISAEIISAIRQGHLSCGSRILSENEIRSRYHVSNTTARKVLAELAQDGWISKRRGSGCFVEKSFIDSNLTRITSFTANVKKLGMESATKVLHQEVFNQGAKQLWIGDKEYILSAPYLYVRRLRLGNSQPIMVEDRFISLACCPGLEQCDLTQSLFALYEETHHCLLISARQLISAILLNAADASQLEYQTGQPGFMVEGILFTTQDRLLELEKCVYRSDRYQFLIDVQR